jgi:hypothetical protein
MSRPEWTLCERSGRWAAALRAALGRTGWPLASLPKIVEVRQLDELTARLEARPDRLALVEVKRGGFADLLVWLSTANRAFPRARFVALVDRGVYEWVDIDPALRRRSRQSVVDTLHEAGAIEVVTSPLQLAALLSLGRQHGLLRSARVDGPAANASIAEWAWASLPWQEE